MRRRTFSLDWRRCCFSLIPVPALCLLVLLGVAPWLHAQTSEPDSDGDGIPDSWEIANGLNAQDPSDAAQDPDNDGIPNLLEYLLGGNPNVSDAGIRPAGGRSANGQNFILRFNQRPLPETIRREVQRTTSLAAPIVWTTNGVSLVQTITNFVPGLYRLTFQSDTPIAQAVQQFMRVRFRVFPTTVVLLHSTLDNVASITSPASGIGGTTTLTAGKFVRGQVGNAAEFTNANDVAIFPATMESRQNVNLDRGEIELWYRPNYDAASNDDSTHALVVVGNVYSPPNIRLTESDRLSFRLTTAGFDAYFASAEYHAPIWQAGQWVKIRAKWDNANPTNSVEMFVNGVRVGGGAVAGGWSIGNVATIGNIYVGAGNAAGDFSANGLIDELIIRGPAPPPGANQSPVVAAITDRTVRQGELLTLQAQASDPDGNNLTFGLAPGAPEGALIHPTTGVFSWTPSADVAPGTYALTIRVTDDGNPNLTAAVSFNVLVEENPAAAVCPAGPPLLGVLGGDIGPASTNNYTNIACIEIRNDRAVERAGIASAGIPVPRELNLTSTEQLAVIGPGERRVAAQFNLISRWGGPLENTTLPIRWLEVSTAARVNPGAKSLYSLRRYQTAPAYNDALAASIAAQGSKFVVDTGLGAFTLDPANPALLEQISAAPNNTGTGRTTIYQHAPGAGPRLVFVSGATDVTLSTASAGQVAVDPNGFSIIERGPVKVVVELKGHFSDPQGRSMVTTGGETYERFGYTLVLTFHRASRDVGIEFYIRNEASDAMFPPWTDEIVTIKDASLQFPFALSNPTLHFAGQGAVAAAAAGSGSVRVEQRRGGGAPWRRRATASVNSMEVQNAEFFDSPFAAMGTAQFVVAAQIPWMRYREPQAIAITGSTVSLSFISEAQIVGEGKGIWNFGKISIRPATLEGDARPLNERLEAIRETGHFELERGLLVRAPREFVNAARLHASLGTGASSPIKTAYVTTMNTLHDQTVRAGGQWDRAKTFGSQLWPDTQRDLFAFDNNATPADCNAGMNYWNPSGAELLEFLRSGDPKWVWDFALPQSWLQVQTAYLNMGEHTHGARNGLAVTSGGAGDGQWHRSAFGSDDYTYDAGLSLAYALRPLSAFRERFNQAAGTVIRRYNIPRANEAQREQFVNRITITRQAIQHFEMLANAAEFVPGQSGTAAHNKLVEIVTELAEDNLAAGVMAEDDDIRPATRLTEPQQFMQNAMMYPFFHRYFRNYGDISGNAIGLANVGLIRRALVTGPLTLYNLGMDKQPDGRSLLINGGWASRPDCGLTANGTQVSGFSRGLDSDGNRNMYNFNKPHTVALMLMAHELDPSIGLCGIARRAYDDPALPQLWGEEMINQPGWWKGASQMMQSMIFGVGLYDTCQ